MTVPTTKLQIKSFATAYKNIQSTFQSSPDFLHKLIKNLHSLDKIRESTSEAGIAAQEKLERWNRFKVVLFQQLFTEIYTNRIANIFTILQLCLTSKRLYEAEKMKQIEEHEDEMITDEQIDQLIVETRENVQQFMGFVYEHMMKPLIERHLYLLIMDIVSQEVDPINLKAQLTLSDLTALLDKIQDRIMQSLIKLENNTQHSTDLDTISIDSEDECERPPQQRSWLVDKMITLMEQHKDEQKPKLQEITEELEDWLETPYVLSVLVDVFESSFQTDLKDPLANSVTTE